MDFKAIWDENYLSKYFLKETFEIIIDQYNEKGRFFHNLNHLENILNLIKKEKENKELLEMAAFFHDVIYNPKSKNNEEDSCDFLLESLKYGIKVAIESNSNNVKSNELETVLNIIKSTKYPFDKNKNKLETIFSNMDCDILKNTSIEKLMKYEEEIFKEFSIFPILIYTIERVKFLRKAGEFFENESLNQLANYVYSKKYNIGIYPGSFNPFHIGHLNVLEKAQNIFDKVIVALGNNPNKDKINEYSLPRYIEKNYEVIYYDDLLPDLIKRQESENVKITLIRGLRNGNDFEHEKNQLRFINEYHKVNTIHIMCDPEYDHISSSSIRQLDKVFNADVEKYLV